MKKDNEFSGEKSDLSFLGKGKTEDLSENIIENKYIDVDKQIEFIRRVIKRGLWLDGDKYYQDYQDYEDFIKYMKSINSPGMKK